MVNETYRPLVHEIFTKVNNAKDRAKKIKVLRDYESAGLRKILKSAFDPNIEWMLPEGSVPYIVNDAPEGTEHTRLENEARSLSNFVAIKVNGKLHEGNPALNTFKREMLFIQLLEGLSAGEAELMLFVKDKKLNRRYKGLNANNIKEAFGWDDNFMQRGVERTI